MVPRTNEAREPFCSVSTFSRELLAALEANDPSVLLDADHCETTGFFPVTTFHVRPKTFDLGARHETSH